MPTDKITVVPRAKCVTCGGPVFFQERTYAPGIVAFSAYCEQSQEHEMPAAVSTLVYNANARQGVGRALREGAQGLE